MDVNLGSNKDVLFAAIVALVIGLAIGYFVHPASTSVDNSSLACAMGQFKVDNGKINEISKTFEDLLYLQSGSTHTLKYVNYTEYDGIIALNFLIDGTYQQPVYVTQNYEYLVQPPVKFSDLKEQVAMAKLQAEESAKPPQKSDKPKVELFVMSYCPYGNLAEIALKPVVDLLGESIDFEPVYIISGYDGKYYSLHGQKELEQDIREKIIFNKYGVKKWMEYVYDADNNCTLNNIDTCWKEVAERKGLNVSEIEAEYSANFNKIADQEVKKTEENGVSASPTLLVNGKMYKGDFVPNSYKNWICGAFNTPPSECSVELSKTSVLKGTSGSCG